MMDRLKSLAVFAETVREGSFRGAARRLGLTPSAVSYHIRVLEEAVDAPLLYRSTRSLSTTDAGEALFRSAEEMLNAARSGLHQATRSEADLSGKLRIALSPALSHSYISQQIVRFARRYPGVELLLNYDNRSSDLIGEAFDLALRSGRLENSSLKCRHLWDMPRTLVAAPKYLAESAPIKRPQDLEALSWLKFEGLQQSRSLIGRRGRKTDVPQAGNITVNSIEAMVDLAVLGAGLASPPHHFITAHLSSGALTQVLPDWRMEAIPVHALWPPSKVENPVTRALLSQILDARSGAAPPA